MPAIKYLEGGIWKTLTMPSAVHVGPSAPDPSIKQLWVDTDEPGPDIAINLTLLNGWTTVVGTSKWWKDLDGNVMFEESLVDGRNATSGVIATLPVGARPATLRTFPTVYWTGSAWVAGRITVASTGNITFHNSSDTFATSPDIFDVSLDQIRFRV